MTGTPSRTATAYGGGTTRHSVVAKAATPRGYVGRKLEAKLRSEEHEAHMRQSNGGRGSPAVQSPKVIRTRDCRCDGYMERKSRVLPREICLSVCEVGSDRGLGTAVKEGPAGRGRVYSTLEQTTHAAYTEEQTREAKRSTKDRQKSAESISCQRTATKEEHMESNRNGTFDA
ncbi:MAG: hypothetical protein GY847_33245 [Proteobacteria bacterium]|nr:hypothetical protein [Pseudomonadota bacterium]